MTAATLAPVATVPRLWEGQIAVCVASGPSLTASDVAYCRTRARVIAVNTTYQRAPWADVLYAADAHWWHWHAGAMDFPGRKYSLERPAPRYGVTTLATAPDDLGLSLDPRALCPNRHSGAQAVNLAVLFGASTILLLGYDYQLGPQGEAHWHPRHTANAVEDPHLVRAKLDRHREAFDWMVDPLRIAGVTVVNCSRRTALTAFPRRPLEDCL